MNPSAQFALLVLVLSLCSFAGTGAWAHVPPPDLIVSLDDNPQLTYALTNSRASDPNFRELSPKAQANFFAIREKYLTALARAVSKKLVARVATGVAWAGQKMDHAKTKDSGDEENSLTEAWANQQILGGTWPPENNFTQSQKAALQQILTTFDNLLWDDCANVSQYDETGFLMIIQLQSGAVAGKYGFFVGGGVAVDVTYDEVANKNHFTLNLYGEKNRRDPHYNIAAAYHLLNLKISVGPQTKHREVTDNRTKTGYGWFLPLAPVHVLFEGDRLATLGNGGLDAGMLTLTAAAGFGWLTQLAAANPLAHAFVAAARAAWQAVLPVGLINKIATPLGILQAVGTVQTHWKTYRLFDFQIKNHRKPRRQPKSKGFHDDKYLTCLKLNSL